MAALHFFFCSPTVSLTLICCYNLMMYDCTCFVFSLKCKKDKQLSSGLQTLKCTMFFQSQWKLTQKFPEKKSNLLFCWDYSSDGKYKRKLHCCVCSCKVFLGFYFYRVYKYLHKRMSIAGVTPCALAKWLMHTDGMANVHVTPGSTTYGRKTPNRWTIGGGTICGKY